MKSEIQYIYFYSLLYLWSSKFYEQFLKISSLDIRGPDQQHICFALYVSYFVATLGSLLRDREVLEIGNFQFLIIESLH